MSNQRTTQLNRLYANEVADADRIPIVDVSATGSGPTGETKGIFAKDLGTWMVDSGVLDLSIPFQASQTSNGLWFDEGVQPNDELDKYCYTPYPPLGTEFTLYVRAFVPSTIVEEDNAHRVLFGVGPSATLIAGEAESAYIGIEWNGIGYDLIGGVNDGTNNKTARLENFFTSHSIDRVFGAALTKDSSNDVTLVANGTHVNTVSSGPVTINNSYLVMGCGQNMTHKNINCTIYEAHVFDSALDQTKLEQLFYRGSNVSQTGIISSYTPENLNPGPTQWLDSVNSYHLLLPVVGARATNPNKKFNLSFRTSASGFLGHPDGTLERDILPAKYILTSCVVESSFKPLICVGTSSSLAPVSASGTGSWQDNRVPYTSASYGVNPLGIVSLGAAHPLRAIYVGFGSSSEAPCTFSFEGYVRN